MTETEAKTKWCPLARVAFDFEPDAATFNVVSANSDLSPVDAKNVLCIASACMFWRVRIPALPATSARPAVPENGFCGAAGVPHLL